MNVYEVICVSSFNYFSLTTLDKMFCCIPGYMNANFCQTLDKEKGKVTSHVSTPKGCTYDLPIPLFVLQNIF